MENNLENKVWVIKKQIVDSSMIASVEYSAKTQTLVVEFTRGNLYNYYKVPEVVFNELIAAESIGKYFNTNIKNVYETEKVV